jgi:hypothetical protein
MSHRGYWVDISQRGTRLGAGFLLTRHFVVTADHCLRGAVADDPLDLSFADSELVPGRIHQQSPESDLALIAVLKSRSGPIVPKGDRSGPGEEWRVPYRPSIADPYLSGSVLDAPVAYQCEGGDTVEALQLGCSAHLGDYSGYSGGPVERSGSVGDAALLGILVEQYPDRRDPQRNSDVLFATTVAEALRRFDCFDVGHLLKVLPQAHAAAEPGSASTAQRVRAAPPEPLGSPPAMSRDLARRFRNADAALWWLKRWELDGVLDASHVWELRARIARDVTDSALGEDA